MRKVLVTGSNTGIGLGLCKELLRQGFYVIACCRKPSYISLFYTEFANISEHFAVCAFDLEQDFSADLEKIEKEHGVPDAIINNAGVWLDQEQEFEIDWQKLQLALSVNLKAPAEICNFFAPKMKDKEWGRIVNVSSRMGSQEDNDSGGRFPYRISKTAQNMYTINLAHAMEDTKVKVFAVHPGWIKTRMGGMNAHDEIETAVERLLFTFSQQAEQYHGKFLRGNEILPW